MTKMRLGVVVQLSSRPGEGFQKVKEMGFSTCQLIGWRRALFTEEIAEAVVAAAKDAEVEISAFWCGWPGPAVWDFLEGPLTLGLVPPTFRWARMEALEAGSAFAQRLGVTDVVTHVGFIPENPNDPLYPEVVSSVRHVARICARNGQRFLFESGQETPITLRRAIEDIGLDNLGVNLDPANLLLYGKANPVDALDVLRDLVWGVHAKDGEYPTDGRRLGTEKPLGKGRVDFPRLLAKLRDFGYAGALTIEREISGEEQARDILAGKKYLEELLGSL